MSHLIRPGSPVKNNGLDGAALAAYLRRRHRHCTAGYVSVRTGIPEATIADWLTGRCRPGTPHLLTLLRCYGMGLLQAAWPGAPDEIVAAAQAARLWIAFGKRFAGNDGATPEGGRP